MIRTIPDESLQLITKICTSLDCNLVDVVLRGSEHRMILDLFIDNRQGVSLDLCSQVNRAIIDESANDKFLSDVYLLEVSSPGVDRPLTFNWQYDKHVGRLVKVSLLDGSTITGKLVTVGPDVIQVEPQTKKKRDAAVAIVDVPFEHISSTTVEIVWK